MITCYSLEGKIYNEGINFLNFDTISSSLKINNKLLYFMPVEAIILILDKYSRKISLDSNLLSVEGVAFFSLFLRKSNMEKLIQNSIGDKSYLNKFIHKGNGKFVKAQGRGIACHWIAGNVPTLAFYSLFQSVIAKNSNIVRVPKNSVNLVLDLLAQLDDIEVEFNSKVYYSKDILKNISLIFFDSDNELLNKNMSIIADVRIIWGGEKAVNSINMFPKKTTCKDVVFGPKYSFAVFDKNIIESSECQKYMNKFVIDVATFNQEACSSPQVLFIEKSSIPLKNTIEKLAKAFEKLNKRHPNIINESTAAQIINIRGIYGLSLDKNLCCSKGLGYTILINDELALEDPVGGRCLFIKEIDSIFDVEDLITRRIQTIGIACTDKDKIIKFADRVTNLGVDRIVNVGLMNIYDYPWDGCFMINELIRWCSTNMA